MEGLSDSVTHPSPSSIINKHFTQLPFRIPAFLQVGLQQDLTTRRKTLSCYVPPGWLKLGKLGIFFGLFSCGTVKRKRQQVNFHICCPTSRFHFQNLRFCPLCIITMPEQIPLFKPKIWFLGGKVFFNQPWSGQTMSLQIILMDDTGNDHKVIRIIASDFTLWHPTFPTTVRTLSDGVKNKEKHTLKPCKSPPPPPNAKSKRATQVMTTSTRTQNVEAVREVRDRKVSTSECDVERWLSHHRTWRAQTESENQVFIQVRKAGQILPKSETQAADCFTNCCFWFCTQCRVKMC